MGNLVNVFLDDLDALLVRLLNFPLVFQLFFWFVAAATVWWFFFWLSGIKLKSLDKKTRFFWFTVSTTVSLLIASAVVLDKKWKLAEEDLSFLQHKQYVTGNIVDSNADDFFSMATEIRLPRHSDAVRATPIYNGEGMQVVRISFSERPVEVFLARIDLTCFEVVLDPEITTKEKTSDFAKRFNADIAVNGEAGKSPSLNAPLGRWVGNYIVKGKPIMMKDSGKRPFVYFDKYSKGFYSNDPEVITEPTKDMYNAIYGRFDLMLDGKIKIDKHDASWRYPYPRTIVGIDKTGQQLYLMVVDGRRGDYSIGLNSRECGVILRKFKVWSAMVCDQGGSSCMYIKHLGIVNRPSDGMERPVYTHLGLRKRDCITHPSS